MTIYGKHDKGSLMVSLKKGNDSDIDVVTLSKKPLHPRETQM